MDGWEQLAALRAVYDGYLEEYRQRLIDNGPFHGLHKFLLGNAPASDRKADAAQGLAIPLVAHLSDRDRADILAAFRSRYPKKRMLTPKQEELLKALEK